LPATMAPIKKHECSEDFFADLAFR